MLRILRMTHRIRRHTHRIDRRVRRLCMITAILLGVCMLSVAHASFYCPLGTCGGISAGVNAAAGNIAGVSSNTPLNTINNILNVITSFVSILAVAVIVIAGMYLIVGLGNENSKEMAKKVVLYTAIGIVLIGLARVIVAFFLDIPTGVDTSNIRQTVINLLYFFLSFTGLLAVVAIVIAGIMLVVSGGDEGRKDTAKKIVIYAIAGLILIGISSAIVRFVESFF